VEGHASAWPYANKSNLNKWSEFMRIISRILLVALLLAAFLPCGTALAWFGSPTAIIVDDETGQPIEGAIALAQWVKHKSTFFEGGIPYAARAEEEVSDKEGKIYIKGYRTFNPFACERHLTVYKPGYALWNSKKEVIPVKDPLPKEFSSSKNTVRLVKFEKAAEEWEEKSTGDVAGKRPHEFHSMFLGDCFELDLDTNSISMQDVFWKQEGSFINKEKEIMWREYDNAKKKNK